VGQVAVWAFRKAISFNYFFISFFLSEKYFDLIEVVKEFVKQAELLYIIKKE
jgi:hypothetical protein